MRYNDVFWEITLNHGNLCENTVIYDEKTLDSEISQKLTRTVLPLSLFIFSVYVTASLKAWNLILFHLKMHMLGNIVINILKVLSWSKTNAVPNFIFFITDKLHSILWKRYFVWTTVFRINSSVHLYGFQEKCMLMFSETTDSSRLDGSIYNKVLMQRRCRGCWCSECWQKVLTESQDSSVVVEPASVILFFSFLFFLKFVIKLEISLLKTARGSIKNWNYIT